MMKTTLINLAFCGVVALTNCFAGDELQNHDTTSSDSDTQSPALTENQIITNSSDSDENGGDVAEKLHAARSEQLKQDRNRVFAKVQRRIQQQRCCYNPKIIVYTSDGEKIVVTGSGKYLIYPYCPKKY